MADPVLAESELRRSAHALAGLAGLLHAVESGSLDHVRAEDLAFLVESLARQHMAAVEAATGVFYAA